MQMDPREALLDAAQHLFIPFNLQIGVQPALHQYAGATQLDRLPDLLVDGLEIQNIALRAPRTFDRSVKGTKRAVLGAEIRVINVSVDNVSGYAFRMQFAPHRVRLHADPDQIVGAEHLQGLRFG